MDLNLQARVVVSEHVLAKETQGELVLLDLQSDAYFGLDQMGASFWQAMTSSDSLGAARKRLLEEFEVEPATLDTDLAALLGELTERGIVTLSVPTE